MSHYPPSILKLIKHFSKLPGIGEKTAERLTMHILRSPRQEATQLAQSIVALKEKIMLCTKCFALSDSEICNVCSNPARDNQLLCIVENPADMVAIERAGAFSGKYHILQGVLSPMDGIGPDDIRIKELLSRITTEKINEIVVATSTTVEGEATANFIVERLKKYNIKVTRIASGVPIGGDLKYIDQVTLKRAMELRHVI